MIGQIGVLIKKSGMQDWNLYIWHLCSRKPSKANTEFRIDSKMFHIRSLNVSDLISPFIEGKWRERGQNKSSPQKFFPLFAVVWVRIIMINNRMGMVKMRLHIQIQVGPTYARCFGSMKICPAYQY